MFMNNNSEPTAVRTDRILSRSPWKQRFTRTLGNVGLALLLAFLATAHAATVPPVATVPGHYGVILNWNPNLDTSVTGYRVYYGTASGNYSSSVNVGNVTNNAVAGLASGITHFFAITAYNAVGDESPFSSEVTVRQADPTVQLRFTGAGQAVLTVRGLVGHAYEVQATQDFKSWTVLGSVTVGSLGVMEFTAPVAAGFSRRFYRTHEVQP